MGDSNGDMLAFFKLLETTEKDGYLGAVLISDIKGIPQEFRCTHPVKPTLIQKPLYGDKLQQYIGVNLCGIPLFNSVSQSPSLTIVEDADLMALRKSLSFPVICIRRYGETIDINSSENSENSVKREKIDCSTGRYQPIVCTPHADFPGDASIAREVLEKVFDSVDPLEPFERISKAVDVLSKQDDRFK